jgi:hypothetical protein
MASEKSSFWGNLVGSLLVLGAVVMVTFSVESSPGGLTYGPTPMGPNPLVGNITDPQVSGDERPAPPELPEGDSSGFPANFSYSEATAVLGYYAAQLDGMVSSEEVRRIKDYLGRNWQSSRDIDDMIQGLERSFESGEMERKLSQALETISQLPYDQQTQILTDSWRFMQDIGMEVAEITRLTYRWLDENLSISIYDIVESLDLNN